MTGAEVRAVREGLRLDHAGLAKLLGVSLRKVFYLEAQGVQSGPTWLVLDMAAQGDLPARYVPEEDALGRVVPIAED